ncbi:hypothetical protein BDZ88DRAFT_434478 [Geranomyces variabilis]|nr:hypothetical protein BDZ88DRAFT_434478 [Geranomyces variabilis]
MLDLDDVNEIVVVILVIEMILVFFMVAPLPVAIRKRILDSTANLPSLATKCFLAGVFFFLSVMLILNINKQMKTHMYTDKIQALGKLVISIFAEYLAIIIISLTLFRRVREPVLDLGATPRANGGDETQHLLAAQRALAADLD